MRRQIPQVDKILRHPLLLSIEAKVKRSLLAEITRIELAALRDKLQAQDPTLDIDQIAQHIACQALELTKPSLRKVINATGVVLNTNLGRAPLPNTAFSGLEEIASGYCNLEIDLASGKRGERSQHIAHLLKYLTSCEEALVVNNNAAAIFLVVNTLASQQDVIVSRGELVEIGGSFRLPEIIAASGANLREVGTTNRTRLDDYERVLGSNTGLIMKCHRSNFEMRGFTEETILTALVSLAKKRHVPLVVDLGSGALFDFSIAGITAEPMVKSVLSAGCDLVTFSADKLMGGPQAGIVVGKKTIIDTLSKNPIYRALRLDKVGIYLLEKILSAYFKPNPEIDIPILAMISAKPAAIQQRVKLFIEKSKQVLKHFTCRLINTSATVGGGALPGQIIESCGIALSSSQYSARSLGEALRAGKPPVFSLIQNNEVILDFRTIMQHEEEPLMQVLLALEKVQMHK